MTNAIKLKGDACQSGGEESSVSDFRISSEVDPDTGNLVHETLGPSLKENVKRSEASERDEWKVNSWFVRGCASSFVVRPHPACKEGGVVVK